MSASNSIKTMDELRESIREAKQWRSLIGSEYHGGGGGIGRIINTHVSMEIYHQYSNGDTNYHPIPCNALKSEMEAIIKGMGTKIIDEAVAALEAKLAVAAALVLKEFEAIRADAEKITTEAKE